MKCLFVIDVQKGFISDKTESILPNIEQLIQNFSKGFIIATQFINTDDSGFTDIMHWQRLKKEPEIDLIPFVKQKADYIIKKTIYSACTDEVLKLLESNEIKEAYIAGIDTDCCVLTTAISLFEHNIRPVVLEKYCASNGGENSHEAAIKVLERTIGIEQIYFDKYQVLEN
jgi:nicotinamidase-related amidase